MSHESLGWENGLVVTKDNFEQLSIFLELLESHVQDGGTIILPKLTSVTDMTQVRCSDKKKKISFAYVWEIDKEYKKDCLTGDTLPFMLAIVPKKEEE